MILIINYLFLASVLFTIGDCIIPKKEWLLEGSSVKNISLQCQQDVETWMNSLKTFEVVGSQCLLAQNCTTDEQLILKENLYAVQQIDAFGKFPTPGILEMTIINSGSPMECDRINGVKYETNYCFLEIYPTIPKNLSSLIYYRSAVCMPKSCKPQDIVQIYNSLNPLYLEAKHAYCAKRDVPKDAAFWSFSVFMILWIAIAVVSTIYDFVRDNYYGLNSGAEKNLWIKIFLAFSFWTNAGLILSVKEQKPGHIKSLDCIRALSMSWVVAGHSAIYTVIGEAFLPVQLVSHNIFNHIITNAVIAVDSFFLISGIVLAYMFFKQKPKSSMMKNPSTWIMFYVHRYLRLTPPIMIFIGFFTVYFAYVQGPFAASAGNFNAYEVKQCQEGWWRNLIYINNFSKSDFLSCYGVTWYLAADTQLYLIAPIFIFALYYSFKLGFLLIALGCVASLILCYTAYYTIPNMAADIMVIDASGEFARNYQLPWIRCTPYLIGILAGYIIGVLSRQPTKPRLHWILILLFWLIAFGIGWTCMLVNYTYDKNNNWSWFDRGSYYNFSRFGWSIAVSWVIIANHFGWGGPISNFMSHPIWQPFGRLSYCAYIVHWVVLFYYVNLGERPLILYSIFQNYMYYGVPASVFSFIAAFFWSCLFEMSTAKMEKILMDVLIRKPKVKDVETKL